MKRRKETLEQKVRRLRKQLRDVKREARVDVGNLLVALDRKGRV